jgi:hypothetical protein
LDFCGLGPVEVFNRRTAAITESRRLIVHCQKRRLRDFGSSHGSPLLCAGFYRERITAKSDRANAKSILVGLIRLRTSATVNGKIGDPFVSDSIDQTHRQSSAQQWSVSAHVGQQKGLRSRGSDCEVPHPTHH